MKICPICKAEYAGGEIFCPLDGGRLSSPSQMHAGPVDPDDPLLGVTLNERYRILQRIGEGGMGIVYEAVHVVIEKRVALKVLRDDFSKRSEVVERFRQEAKSASRIGHEHIVDISDFGETPSGQSYFVMEYLEGEDLANVLAALGTVAAPRAVDIVLQCCKALGAAHAKGIVHRDMKPENVFLVSRDTQDDFVKIVDFGIAKMSDIETEGAPGRKLTKTGMIFGTPEYMSPEQAAGKPLDHRVDVYAVGVILYETLAGRVPFVGDTFMGILTQHMFEDVPTLRSVNPNVSCSEELEMVIMNALVKDPDRRYQSMDELGRAIAGAMDLSGAWSFADPTSPGYGEPVKAARRVPRLIAAESAPTAEFPQPRRRGKTMLLMSLGLLLLAGAGVGGYLALRPGTTSATGLDRPLTVAGPAAGGVGERDADASTTGDGAPRPALSGRDAGGAIHSFASARNMVLVQVVTRPEGAQVRLDGRGIVCERTPCTFESEAGRSVDLRAHRGLRRASRTFTPEGESFLVEMALPRPARPVGVGAGMHHSGGMMHSVHSDLKIPDPFRESP